MSIRNSSKKFHLPAIRKSIALSTLIVVSPFAQSAFVDWTTDVSGQWNDASLWSSNPALPSNVDIVSITTVTGLKTVTHDTGNDIIKSIITNDSARLLINGGSSLTLNAAGSTNAGILQAGGTSAGTLLINGGSVANTDGELLADNDGVIQLNGVNVVGGELNSSGNGRFQVSSSAANYLRGVTLNGVLDMTSIINSRQRIRDDMTLNGTIDINSNGILSSENDNLIDGTGSVVFGGTGAGNRFNLDGNGTTTLGSGITIRGENGTIGTQANIAGTQVLVNEGLISADVSGGTITIQESAVINNNVLEARNGGTLDLRTQVDNTAGEIRADDGVVNLGGMRVIGGDLNAIGSGKFLVTASANNRLEGVTVTGLVDMASNVNSRQRVSDGLTLDSTVDINNNGILSFEGDNLLEGTGSVVFGSTGAGNRLDLDANGTTTIGSNMTVRGENGTIGRQINVAGTQVLVNEGLISADVSGGTITIQESAVINNSVLEARNGGTLNLLTQVDNSAGEILADNSVVGLNAMKVIGGDLNSTGSGKFLVTASAANRLEGVNLNGMLDMASIVNSRQRITNNLTLDGTVNINGNGILSSEGDNNLDGNGTIVLGDTGPGNRFDLDGNGTTTLGSDIVIRGKNGTIGKQINIAGTQVLVNNGLISADVADGTITIEESKVDNNTVIEARNGATLVLKSDITNDPSAEIHADNSLIRQEAMRVTGGKISTVNGGVFRANGSGANILDGTVFEGMLDMSTIANSREVVLNDLTLDGTVNINKNGILSFRDTNVLDGDATVVLGDTGAGNRISLDGNGTTTLASGVTVRGENGTIGGNSFIAGTQVLVNNGLISADVAGGRITIEDSKVDNNTVLEARNDATLVLKSDINNAASAEIHADNGLILQEAMRVTGGKISTENGGVFRANGSGANILDGTTIEGILDMSTIVNSREVVLNDLTVDGTVNINKNGILSFRNTNVLDGDATVVLSDTGPGNRISLDGNGTTTLASGVTIRGKNGVIGGNSFIAGTQRLVNNGLISADVADGTFTITDSTVDNNNVLEARNGATLVLDSNVDNSASGMIHADNGTVVQSGQRVTGGAITTENGGTFRVSSSGANFLDGTTIAGTVDMTTSNSRERVVNDLTLDGELNLNSNGRLSFEGSNTVDGSGTFILGDSGAGNQITLEGNGTTTIGSGITIRGENGTIGNNVQVAGTQVLINNGIVNSDGGGTITFTDSAVTNNGLLRAENGTMTSQVQVSGTGTLQVDSTGVMNLDNVANTQGKLVMGAAGAALDISTENLTINSDYTNIAAGSGNSFNRRAGVSGAGQIVAGGDVAQAITGSGVTDGDTPNATLTIGNMRVGDNTFNYQVANTGTTGPSLRGAIQTNVNGGNIDDGRLSGAGVTPSNYNTGGPGGDTGDLDVVFTAANAGALAPLVDQTINLRSNFENIGDQQLDIVLAGGAAAYNAAAGDAGSPVQVANQRIGGTNSAAVTVTNTADAGSFSEDLNTVIGGNSGAASGSGSVAGLLAGASNNSNISVAVDTSSAGAKAGNVTLDYETTGTVNGVSNGLGTASAGSQDVAVNGNVYQVAQADGAIPATVNLGNFRAGSGAQAAPGIDIANTDIAPAGFQEGLAATVGSATGQATGSGFANAVAGSSGTINVGLSSINAGLNTGTVDVQLKSNGTTTGGSNGLGDLNLGGAETITVSGTGWRLAEANTLAPTIDFGNVLIGSVQAQFLDIQNTAANDGFSERLDAIFKAGGTTGDATNNGGSIALLDAGSSNNAAMSVGIDTSSIGGKSGQVVVAFDSNGSGTSGLGITGLPDQSVGVLANVEANVGTLAQPGPVSPNPVDFGKVRIDSAAVGPVDLSISNLAVVGEGLNASISTLSSGFDANGSFTSLAPGATDNGSLQVAFNGTDTAGAKTGTATLALVSDGSFNGGVTTNLPSQTVDMSAEVYRLANPLLNTTSVDVVARVGDAVSANQAVSISNASPDIYTEGLKVAISGSTGNAQGNGGSIANLAAQGTDSTSIMVGLASTATAGVSSDSVNLDFISTGAGTTGAADVAAQTPGGSVTVNGKVYALAEGKLNTPTVDFGIVRVGDVVAARNINVENAAPTVALNDTLRANLSGVGSAFSADSTVGNIAAGDNGNLAVDLNTATAGIYNQTGTVDFLSQNPDMADVSAGPDGTVQVSAQVNNLANAHFELLSSPGILTQSGDDYILDFGTILLGDSRMGMLQLENDIFGPADFLMGDFDFTAVDDFLFTGWDPFSGLGAGDAISGLNVDFTSSGLGLFEDTIAFNGSSYNDSDPTGLAQTRSLQVRVNVIDSNAVPTPGTIFLIVIGLLAMRQRLTTRRRQP